MKNGNFDDLMKEWLQILQEKTFATGSREQNLTIGYVLHLGIFKPKVEKPQHLLWMHIKHLDWWLALSIWRNLNVKFQSTPSENFKGFIRFCWQVSDSKI